MIYLFNSAYRHLYTTDVLNTLALPIGATIIHRYRAGPSTPSHVEPQLLASLQGSQGSKGLRQGKDCLVRCSAFVGLHQFFKSEEVVLLFVDRENHYEYFPLRRGSLYDNWERDGRLYFRVRLGEFIAGRSGAAHAVSERIKASLGQQGPATPDAGAPPTHDGFYALRADDSWCKCDQIVTGEDAWNATVDALSQTHKFECTADRHVMFVRSSIGRRSGKEPEIPRIDGPSEVVRVQRDLPYEIRISYRTLANQTPSSQIVVEGGDNLQFLGSTIAPISAAADDLVTPFVTKRYVDDRYSFMNISVVGLESSTITTVGPSTGVIIGLRERRSWWLAVAVALAGFTLSTLILAIKPTDVRASTSVWDFGLALVEHVTLWRLVAAAAQTFVLFLLFRLIGKKPV